MAIENGSGKSPDTESEEQPLSKETFGAILSETTRIALRGDDTTAKDFGKFRKAIAQGLDERLIMGKSYSRLDKTTGCLRHILVNSYNERASRIDPLPDGSLPVTEMHYSFGRGLEGEENEGSESGSDIAFAAHVTSHGKVLYKIESADLGTEHEIAAATEEEAKKWGVPIVFNDRSASKSGKLDESQGLKFLHALWGIRDTLR